MENEKARQQILEEAYLNSLFGVAEDTEQNHGLVVSQPAKLIVSEPDAVLPLVSDHNTLSVEPSVQPGNVDDENSAELMPQPGSQSELPFMGQLFEVAGLRCVLPLSSFSHILPWPDDLSLSEKNKHHLLGQVKINDQLISISDITTMLVPDNRLENKPAVEYTKSAKIIVFLGGRAGLACNKVLEMVKVEPEKVCWRDASSERIWLAGIVKSDSYALLDVNGILQLLG